MPHSRTEVPVLTARTQMKFWDNVRFTDTCWLWTAGLTTRGYGKLTALGPRTVLAHRWSFYIATGKWTDLYVLHTCDTPACVNPVHLYEGTHLDNMRDERERGRTAKGEKNGGGGKLTWELVRLIRAEYAARDPNAPKYGPSASEHVTATSLAAKHGVSIVMACNIIRGDSWKE